jgi:hypothetical protein
MIISTDTEKALDTIPHNKISKETRNRRNIPHHKKDNI